MFKLLNTKANLNKLERLANVLAFKAKTGDVFLLNGDLGSGKTTFVRFFINSIFKKYSLQLPSFVKSPTYSIMINYYVHNFEVFHYDLYRIRDRDELIELNIEENIKKNITLIEWPEIINQNIKLEKYFIINFDIIDDFIRLIEVNSNKSREIIDGF